MAIENILPLFVFAGALVCTPGPANMLLMTAGAGAGLRACLPLVAGVTFGKLFVHLSLALGLWQIIQQFPAVLTAMKIAGAIYILWLARKILALRIEKGGAAPAGFFAGLAVHPLNPKAWAMVAAAYGQFIDSEESWWAQTFIIALVFLMWQCAAHSFWCWSGGRLSSMTSSPKTQKNILRAMAALMVAAVVWSLAG